MKLMGTFIIDHIEWVVFIVVTVVTNIYLFGRATEHYTKRLEDAEKKNEKLKSELDEHIREAAPLMLEFRILKNAEIDKERRLEALETSVENISKKIDVKFDHLYDILLNGDPRGRART